MVRVRMILKDLLAHCTDLSLPVGISNGASRRSQPFSPLFLPPPHFLPPSDGSMLSIYAGLPSVFVDDGVAPAARQLLHEASPAFLPFLSSILAPSLPLNEKPVSLRASEEPLMTLATASKGQVVGCVLEEGAVVRSSSERVLRRSSRYVFLLCPVDHPSILT